MALLSKSLDNENPQAQQLYRPSISMVCRVLSFYVATALLLNDKITDGTDLQGQVIESLVWYKSTSRLGARYQNQIHK